MTSTAPADRPRIAICGLSLEASTFNPGATTIADFHPRRGAEVLDQRPFWGAGGALADAADWVPVLTGRSIPGAPVPAADYASLKAEILDGLRAAVAETPLDGLVFDIHGAMNVVGMDDAEGDLAVAVREVVGPDVIMSTGMDLHGNVSWRLAHALDLLTCYRMAPHEDALETKERAVRNLIDRLALPPEQRRPLKAWVPVPILLPGEKTSTRLEPATSLYARVPRIEALDGVLDAAIWIGYAWGDEPRNCCVVMVTGDDQELITREAEQLARAVWDARDEFQFVAPTGSLAEVLDIALASDARPYLISDSGDNPTAGGTGDVSWTLGELIADPRLTDGDVTTIFASVHDRQATDACVAAGVGAEVTVPVGGIVDPGPRGPVEVTGRVAHIAEGDPDAEVEVVLAVGRLQVIITRNRKPYHRMADFERNGLDAPHADLVIVKIGYLEPELYAIAADWMMALTPGSVDQDLLRLGHTRISRPMFPFDTGFTDPDLHARIVPMADQPVGQPG
ncbi:microcystin degradation protein MlrC [Friedmanniella endophytica]|uniref:Microcystin degradation protein MlrC n=1 Tax=Microlunatus kandeliicorticis TaxID=1759536 RepID=A0A7W3INP9_9ACTN|nr:M81 family metallopeptidase [Microlunatus kandeliicorticis]MBA8792424.1 microcystin degradation protein MlrC [Microlunatus kandeliicorticis]